MTDPQVAIARRELVQSQTDIQEGLLLIQDFKITSDDDQEFAAGVLREWKAKHKALEVKRKTITVPMNTALKEVNNLFRPMREALEEGETILKGKIVTYQQERAVANQEALQAASEAETVEEAQEALAETAPVQSPKGVNVRYRWQATVVDDSVLPREWMMPNVGLIEKHARLMSPDKKPHAIPGVEFSRVPIVTARQT